MLANGWGKSILFAFILYMFGRISVVPFKAILWSSSKHAKKGIASEKHNECARKRKTPQHYFLWIVSTFVFSLLVFFLLRPFWWCFFFFFFFLQKQENIMQRWNRKIVTWNLRARKHILVIHFFFSSHFSGFSCSSPALAAVKHPLKA